MKTEELQNHIDFLLSEALRQCGSLSNAEDLTQDVLLEALAYIIRGGQMENPRGWLKTVLRRRYYDRLRKKYRLASVTNGYDVDEIDPAEQLVQQEEAERIRREVAHLSASYRTIIARHYFYGESIAAIATALDLPEGTVKSRMDFGRKQLKKGMDTMKAYTEQSYLPKQLKVRNSGQSGLHDEPMSLVEDDLLAQNLLILAYDKPIGIPALSKAIGVSAAYIEPVVKKLIDGELMKQTGDGRVYTDFILYHADDFLKYRADQEQFAADHAAAYCEPAAQAIEALKKTEFYSPRLERFLLIYIAEQGLYANRHTGWEFPDRPNGGQWIAFGMIIPEKLPDSIDDYSLGGMRRTTLSQYLWINDPQMYNYETSLYPYPKHSGFSYQNFQELEGDMLRLFCQIAKGIPPEQADIDGRMLRAIPLLTERGFLTTAGETPKLLIPCLTHEQAKQFWQIGQKAWREVSERLAEPIAEYLRTHRKSIPPHLTGIPEQKRTYPYEPAPMMLVFEAIRRGLHPRDLGYPCPETFIVVD